MRAAAYFAVVSALALCAGHWIVARAVRRALVAQSFIGFQ
jgi:hypothetical protein